jgi:uncharacterized protein YwqG
MPESLDALIAKHGLTAYAEQIRALAKPAIRLETRPVEEDTLPIGATKIGGLPDLPAGVAWPMWKGLPQALIAQINLRDVAEYDIEKALPQTGMLYFFYDIAQSTWGFDPKDRGSWQVIYFDGDCTSLTRTRPPEITLPSVTPLPWWKRLFGGSKTVDNSIPADVPANGIYLPCAVTCSLSLVPPDTDACTFNMSDEEADAYYALLEETGTTLLGNPITIQGPMEEEVALVSGGLYCGNASGYHDPRAEALRATAADWRLLLQVNSDENAQMMWGDVGMLYFWININDLQARNFSNTWMILQCS